MMRSTILMLACCSAVAVNAQVRSDGPLILNGLGSIDRQLNGLSPSLTPGDVLSAEVEQSRTHRFVNNTAGTTWQITLTTFDTPIEAGTQFMITAPTSINGPVQIQVGAQGPYPLFWKPGEAILGEDIPDGMIISAVFDGAVFQVLNGRAHKLRECPTGMIEIGTQYCIDPEQQPQGTTDFFDAANNCALSGKRLCTWAEFAAACPDAGILGLIAASGDYEWVDDSANEVLNVRVVRLLTCQFPSHRSSTTSVAPSRCCYTR